MYKKFMKRFLDLVLSIMAFIILMPLMLIIYILVRVKLGKPAIFKQERPGKDEKIFTLYKFRTMTDEKDENGNLLPDEQRLTKFGKILRSTSLDELPELVNIIKGDMSIVGPRPLLVEYLRCYTEEERKRHEVRPGLTGLAQISGRNSISWEEKFKEDLRYIQHISFINDLRIVLKTATKVLKREGIKQEGEATMSNLLEERKKNKIMKESILFCSVGRRTKLLQDFKNTLNGEYNLVATDNSNIAPALYVADKSYIVPKIYDTNYINTILSICNKENVKAVMTLIDPEIEVLAKNESKFTEKGIKLFIPEYETAHLCFDKYEMYKYLTSKQIKTVLTYRTFEDFIDGYNKGKIKFPVFVKPVSGSGSIGARKIENMEDLKSATDDDCNLIIQEFMDGIDLDADVYIDIISNKVVNAFSKKKLSTRIGGANKTISFKDEKLFNTIKEIVKVFKFRGTIDIDFFYKNGEYYLSEVNPRFGGAYIHAYGSGVDFVKNIVNNIQGNENKEEIGNYEEDIVMMMYDDVIIKKKNELV